MSWIFVLFDILKKKTKQIVIFAHIKIQESCGLHYFFPRSQYTI